MPLRLGFLDDACDNWHANTFLRLLRHELAARATVVGVHGLRPDEGRRWAAAQGLAWYDEPSALARDCDALMVLAPSTPQTHPELAARALPAGLPTYIDKTFAASLVEAQAIFALADRHHAPVQSSSALRWSGIRRELDAAGGSADIRQVTTWGGGRSFGEYAIHPLELAISLLGPDLNRLWRDGDGDLSRLVLTGGDGRSAVVNVCCGIETPFAAVVTTARATRWLAVDGGTLFRDALDGICDFLADGRPRVDRRETLVIRAILDAASDPACRAGFVSLPEIRP